MIDENGWRVHGKDSKGRLHEGLLVGKEEIVVEVDDDISTIEIIEFSLVRVGVINASYVESSAQSVAFVGTQEYELFELTIDPKYLVRSHCCIQE